MSNNKVTFQDIADYTHFSKTTISRYFNHPEYLTEENRATIRDALKVLHYQENKIGRILAKGETELIGVIVPNLMMPFYSEVFQNLLNHYSGSGYKFIVFSGNSDASREETYIRELLSYKIEGLIVLSHTLPSSFLASIGIPVVTIEREDEHVSSVNTDNLLGGVQATSYLYKKGCEAYFFIDGEGNDHIPAYQRYVGFEQVCRYENLKHESFIQDLGSSPEAVYSGICKIIDTIELHHSASEIGIFAGNDYYASMVQKYYYQHYNILNRHYHLVGFDGSRISWESIVPFSSVSQQTDRLAIEAMEILVRKIQLSNEQASSGQSIEHKVLTPVLTVRDAF